MENPSTPPARKPWPMKWIVLAIVVYIAGYTFINIAYRKPAGSAHEPYAEAQQRSLRTVQTTMSGWTRVACTLAGDAAAVRPGGSATITEAPLPARLDKHLPQDLPPIMPGAPALHPASLALQAPAAQAAGEALRVRLEFPGGAAVPAFGEVLAYFKDRHLYLFIQDESHVAPDSQPTPALSPLALVLPPATLTPGTWQASAFTATQAFSWSFTVE